jgi:hypothetical protein
MRARFRVLAEIAGAAAGDIAKRAAESAEAAPARVEGDFADGHLRVPQKRLGFFDAAREQVAMRWQSEGLLELTCEMRRGDVADLGEALDGPLFVGRGIHAVLRAKQPAQ